MKKNTSSGDCNIVTYKIKKKKKIKYSLAKCNFCYIKKILYILNVGLFWSINCAFYCNLRVNVIIQQLHLPRGLQSNNFHDQSLRQLLFTQKKTVFGESEEKSVFVSPFIPPSDFLSHTVCLLNLFIVQALEKNHTIP